MARPAHRGAPASEPSALEAVVFDLDGVLTDTAEYHYQGWQRLADEQGWRFDRTLNERLRGVSRMESLDIILQANDLAVDEDTKQAWADAKNQYYVAALDAVSPDDLLPGALELVLAGKERGLHVAIGSSSRNAITVLDRLEITGLFDAISDGNAVERAKPAPDLFLHAAEQLGVAQERCAVIEDAESGVDAALAAGMLAVGIGPEERVGHAHHRVDEVAAIDLDRLLHPDGPSEEHLQNNVIVSSGWEIRERVWEPGQLLTTGSNYLIGNGYLGYRGTFPEWTAEQHTGCIVSDTYDCADGRWTELCNAPNALHARWSIGDEPVVMLPGQLEGVADYSRELNLRYGVHRRRWTHRGPGTNLTCLLDERFASADDLHVIPMRTVVEVTEPAEVTLRTGIDGRVWDLNGDHYRSLRADTDDDELVITCRTTEQDLELTVVQALRVVGGPAPARQQLVEDERRLLRQLTFTLQPGEPLELLTVMAVHSGNDVAEPRPAALRSARRIADLGYQRAKARHVARWDRRWATLDMRLDGDLAAQTLLRYNLYQAVIATPTHTDHLPIAARGLSCQAYQGGAFWDQEIFNLPMWLHTDPDQARRILRYRHRTLDGARRKASALGFEGAFYAWISGLTGDELCPSRFFRDVISGRPFTNHFNDWQIHVSPDIAYAIGQYLQATGDWDFVADHGAEMLFEIARFLRSRVHLKADKGRYEIVRVVGPDEYHEGVDANAFTNWLARHALQTALEALDHLERCHADRLAALRAALDLDDDEIAAWRDIAARLDLPRPDPDTGLIEQFDGYFQLEDTTPEALRERLLHPGEYWGWPNGVAVETQVIKQADVVQLLLMLADEFTAEQAEANYDRYEPRTQHGSSLSPSSHAVVASRVRRHREAHRMFMASCGTDLFTRESQVSGGTFIGGIHTAACGAAWLVVAAGFCGLRVHDSHIELRPRLPEHWRRLTFPMVWRGRRLRVAAHPDSVAVTADPANDGPLPVRLWDAPLELQPGETARRRQPI